MQVKGNNFTKIFTLSDANENKLKSDDKKTEEKLLSIKEEQEDLTKKFFLNSFNSENDDEIEAEIRSAKADISSSKLILVKVQKQLQNNQLIAQMGCAPFVKMIADTTDIAGYEIMTNLSTVIEQFYKSALNGNFSISDFRSKYSELQNAIDEAFCKMDIQLALSNAALNANSIIEKMRQVGVDDTEIRELFENYANNMDTSIMGVSKFEKKVNENGNKNISATADDSELDNKIRDLKSKRKEERHKLSSKETTLQEKQQAKVKIEGYDFLIEMYSYIKKEISSLNKSILDLFKF